jgi:transcriptional regulator with XRE-family HTH domain
LGLRDCALQANIDFGNLSKIERGRMAPPQDPALINRLVTVLGCDGTEEGDLLRDSAAIENGRIPAAALADTKVMAALPIFLRTAQNRQLDEATAEKLVEMIRSA